MRILLVEDTHDVGEAISRRFETIGHTVDWQTDGRAASEILDFTDYDLVILDVMLPGLDGFEILKRLRQNRNVVPVMVLTARSEIDDRVSALDLGADDYLVKPFHVEELLARINALVRRAAGWSKPALECGPVTLDLAAQTVSVSGTNVDLTSYEYKVLEYLMMHAGELVSKADLTEHIYQQDFDRVSAWVMANRDLIDEFWEGDIASAEEVLRRVRKAPGPTWR